MRVKIMAAAIVGFGTFACASTPQQSTTPDNENIAQAEAQPTTEQQATAKNSEPLEVTPSVSLEQALEKAQQEFKGIPAIQIEREEREGQKVLEVEFLKGKEIHEVYLNAESGDTIEKSLEKLEAKEVKELPKLAKAIKQSKTTLKDALAFVNEKHDPASISEIEFKLRDGKLAVEVEVVENGETQELSYDPVSKKLLSEAEEEPKAEEKPKAAAAKKAAGAEKATDAKNATDAKKAATSNQADRANKAAGPGKVVAPNRAEKANNKNN